MWSNSCLVPQFPLLGFCVEWSVQECPAPHVSTFQTEVSLCFFLFFPGPEVCVIFTALLGADGQCVPGQWTTTALLPSFSESTLCLQARTFSCHWLLTRPPCAHMDLHWCLFPGFFFNHLTSPGKIASGSDSPEMRHASTFLESFTSESPNHHPGPSNNPSSMKYD